MKVRKSKNKSHRRGRKQKSYVRRLYQSIYLALVLAIMFGNSAIGKAAQRIRRIVKSKKSFLFSSQSAYVMTKPWGYFQPVWDMDNSEIPESPADRENIINDPDHKIESDFQVPNGLKGRVMFWMDIYSRFSTEYRVVHDRIDPSIIYGYIDLRPIYRMYQNPRTAHARARQVEKQIIEELKARYYEAMDLAPVKKPKLTPEEKESMRKIMADTGADSEHEIRTRIRHIRAQSGQADMLLRGIQRSAKYLPEIEEIFKKADLPVALTRLPFVESSFNPRALSRVGAMGIWQFTPDTAKIFYPKGTYAEWADPIRQSRSAAKMFVSFKKKLPDWGTAVTAYNSGPLRLVKLVKKHEADGIEDLLKVPSAVGGLGFAGKNFYCELLAANIVEAYKEKLFNSAHLDNPDLVLSRRTIPTKVKTTVSITKKDKN